MRLTASLAGLLFVATAGTACSQQPTASRQATIAASANKSADQSASMSRSPELQWGPAPAIFPAGAEMAVLQGNPAGHEMFAVRLRFPSGYRIAPHTHPTDEHVTVIRGTLLVGMGENFEARSMMPLKDGGFVTAPANHAHYVEARGRTEVQVHAMGPFALTYVNPADTPAAARP